MVESKPDGHTLADAILAKPHPLRRSLRIVTVFGVVLLLPAVQFASDLGYELRHGAVDFALLAASLLSLSLGLFLLLYGRYTLKLLPGIQLVNAAVNEITLGRYEVAEGLLSRAEPQRSLTDPPETPSIILRYVALHRAAIALGRGDLDKTIREADRALAVPATFRDKANQRLATLRALAIRAFARALSDDAQGARDDIARLRREARATSLGIAVAGGESTITEPLSRASLAEAVVLARAGENEALRSLLSRSRETMLEHVVPRERALLRGIERKLSVPRSSPYRRAPKVEPKAGDEPEIEDWIERVLPEVAPFVAHASRSEPTSSASERATGKTSRADVPALPSTATRPAWMRRLVAFGLIAAIGVSAAVVSLQRNDATDGGSREAARAMTMAGVIDVLPPLIVLAMSMMVGLAFARTRRAQHTLQSGYLAIAEGSFDEARSTLDTLPRGAASLYHGLASLSLARIATRACRYEEALAHAETGLGAIIVGRARASASDVLEPELVTERAAALAVLGRTEEALALIASLPLGFAFRGRSLFRVRLYACVKAGRLGEAAAVLSERTEQLPIDPRTELVASLVREVSAPGSSGAVEQKRLEGEVRERATRAFLEKTFPDLLSAFEQIGDLGDESVSPSIDEEAEAEADAESSDETEEATRSAHHGR